MFVEDHHSEKELKAVIKRQTTPRTALRLQAVLLAKKGLTAPARSEMLPLSRRSVQNYVYRYNNNSLARLNDNYARDNRNMLTKEQRQALIDHFDRQALEPEGGTRVADHVGNWVESQFNVLYSLFGFYKLLHNLGYSWLPLHLQNPCSQKYSRVILTK